VVVQKCGARAYVSIPANCQCPFLDEWTPVSALSQAAACNAQGMVSAHDLIDRFPGCRTNIHLRKFEVAQQRSRSVNGVIYGMGIQDLILHFRRIRKNICNKRVPRSQPAGQTEDGGKVGDIALHGHKHNAKVRLEKKIQMHGMIFRPAGMAKLDKVVEHFRQGGAQAHILVAFGRCSIQ
jgi:hypothetical protein